jgi:hypothetical protein
LTSALLVKPTLSVLALILVVASLIQLFHDSTFRTALPAASLLVAATLLGPLAWASFNAITLGHFVYSKNAAWALQNFSAKRFVRLPIDDPELRVLQWHAQRTLETPRERSWSPPGHFVFTRSFSQVTEELGMDGEYDFLVLIERANNMAIRSHPMQFIVGGLERTRETWVKPYMHPKNKEAQRRVRDEPLISRLARQDDRLLLGRWTGAALLILGCFAIWQARAEERTFLISAVLFVIVYTVLTGLFDEAEVLRHSMQHRVLTNVLVIWCGWVVLRSIGLRARALAGRSH